MCRGATSMVRLAVVILLSLESGNLPIFQAFLHKFLTNVVKYNLHHVRELWESVEEDSWSRADVRHKFICGWKAKKAPISVSALLLFELLTDDTKPVNYCCCHVHDVRHWNIYFTYSLVNCFTRVEAVCLMLSQVMQFLWWLLTSAM